MNKILHDEKKILRHSLTVRVIHWVIALSTFVLIFSGFGQLPIYQRYMLTDVANFEWTGDYWVTLLIHYIAALVLIIAGFWHITYHAVRKEYGLIPRRGDLSESAKIIVSMITGKPEPPSEKYLAEQRLSYLIMAVMFSLIFISGIVKVIKNMGIYVNDSIIFYSTVFHNVATIFLILSIVGHVAAFLVPLNAKLLPSIFTGKVDIDYIKHRHSIWYNKLYGRQDK